MSQSTEPEYMKCPGCKDIVSVATYGEHITSGHVKGKKIATIADPTAPAPGQAALAPPSKGQKVSVLKGIVAMAEEYPQSWLYWSIAMVGIGVVLGARLII